MTTQRVERVIAGRDLEIRCADDVDTEGLAMRLTGLAHDLLAEIRSGREVATGKPAEGMFAAARPRAARRTHVCPVCDASGDDPCRDMRPGRDREMNKPHADRS